MMWPRHKMRSRHLVFCFAVMGWGAGGAFADAQAMPIELSAFDGSALIKGDLLEISHGSYVVNTLLGTLRISIDEAECVSERCPRLERFDADFAVINASAGLQSSMQSLLAGYAATLDAVFEIQDTDEAASNIAIVSEDGQQQIADVSLAVLETAQIADDTGGRGGPLIGGGQDVQTLVSAFAEADPAQVVDGQAHNNVLLALDGIAMIVHPDNPIAVLSRGEIARQFGCDDDTQTSLVGRSGSLRLYAQERSSDSFDTFKSLVLDPFGLDLCADVTLLSSDADVAHAIANDRRGLGFVSLAYDHRTRAVAIAECGLVHQASIFGAKTGEYPLSRHLLLKTVGLDRTAGPVQRFIDFALSDAGQQALEDAGRIGLNLDTTGTQSSSYRLARIKAATGRLEDSAVVGRLLEQIQGAVRLSSTFRFSSGVSNADDQLELDRRAQRDLGRVVRYLRADAPPGTEVHVLGFADASGDYALNLSLSEQRARSVAAKLRSLGVPVAATGGFGEESAIACNDTATGRSYNRRVEIWLRFPEKNTTRPAHRITM